jgi:hypothetical protein
VVELYVSVDGYSFLKWSTFEAELSSEIQFFKIDPLPPRYKYLKLRVMETFGAGKVYINQVLLLDDCPTGSKFSPEKPSPREMPTPRRLKRKKRDEVDLKTKPDLPRSPAKLATTLYHRRNVSYDELNEKIGSMHHCVESMRIESCLPATSFISH